MGQMKLADISGNRFGKLIAYWPAGRGTSMRKVHWLCACDCGNFTAVQAENLKKGNTGSCGCDGSRTRIKSLMTTHGHTVERKPSRTYNSWVGMMNRCTNPNQNTWKDYGGRGI